MKKTLMLVGILSLSFSLFAQDNTSERNQGYHAFIDIGGGLASTDYSKLWGEGGGLSLKTTHGLYLYPRMYVGAGLGINYYASLENVEFSYNDSHTIMFIPLYGDVRFDFLKKTNTPYIDLKAGYSFSTKSYFSSGAFLNPSIGYSLGNFYFSLGFITQFTKREREEGLLPHYTHDLNGDGVVDVIEKDNSPIIDYYVPYVIEEKKLTISQYTVGFGFKW